MKDQDRQSCIAAALRAHGPALRRYVLARARTSDADDILQIAAMRAIEKAETLRDPNRVLSWLYRIHRNVMVDVGRKSISEQRLKDALTAEPAPVETDNTSTCGCSVEQVRQLNDRHASILNLVDIGDASLGEAARILDITVNAATVRLHRARHALKQRLAKHCGVTSASDCADCRCTYDGCCAA
ncbi:MAG: RNA polymerase sigma factor [Pseudomonadota bacterium]